MANWRQQKQPIDFMHATYDRLPLAHTHAHERSSVSFSACVHVILDQAIHYHTIPHFISFRKSLSDNEKRIPLNLYRKCLCVRVCTLRDFSSLARSDFELVQMNLTNKIQKITKIVTKFSVCIDRSSSLCCVNLNDQFERSQVSGIIYFCFVLYFSFHFPQHTCTHTHMLALLANKLLCCCCCRHCMCLRMHNV